MLSFRVLLLTLGPVVLIALSYGVSSNRASVEPSARRFFEEACEAAESALQAMGWAPRPETGPSPPAQSPPAAAGGIRGVGAADRPRPPASADGAAPASPDSVPLTDACRRKAASIARQLADDCHVIVRPPFVVG